MGSVFIEARDKGILRALNQREAVERLSMIEDGRGVLNMLHRGKIYLIGSLRNPKIPEIANRLREEGFEVFDDWFSAGYEADDKWRDYEKGKGHDLPIALEGLAADHVYSFDMFHLGRCDIAILALPSGRSGHLELGWVAGVAWAIGGKKTYILLEGDPERYDVMYKMATGVFFKLDELIRELKG